MKLGKKIEMLRKKRGWSLDELSIYTEIPKSTLADYESSNDGKISNLIKIANTLNVPLDDLMDENYVQINNGNENKNIQTHINLNFDIKDKNDLKEVVETIHSVFSN